MFFEKSISKKDKNSESVKGKAQENPKKVKKEEKQKDKKQEQENLESAAKALLDAKKIAKDLELDMNFISSNYTFDKKQLQNQIVKLQQPLFAPS